MSKKPTRHPSSYGRPSGSTIREPHGSEAFTTKWRTTAAWKDEEDGGGDGYPRPERSGAAGEERATDKPGGGGGEEEGGEEAAVMGYSTTCGREGGVLFEDYSETESEKDAYVNSKHPHTSVPKKTAAITAAATKDPESAIQKGLACVPPNYS
ncbi:hypothetical protein PG993_005984 [Apiospora rasikravindrae]|uniref:Uncharacterized protein n=1 Tax=Apiospora rasikravindrae TaxID=990691 RepID=A0ABR1TAB7_9PEZI